MRKSIHFDVMNVSDKKAPADRVSVAGSFFYFVHFASKYTRPYSYALYQFVVSVAVAAFTTVVVFASSAILSKPAITAS